MKHLPMEVLDESVWKRFDSDGRLFWNMNTPEDCELARKILEPKTLHLLSFIIPAIAATGNPTA